MNKNKQTSKQKAITNILFCRHMVNIVWKNKTFHRKILEFRIETL